MASGATDRALLDSPSSVYIINSNIDHTFTYTPNSNYYINSITIGGTDGSPAQTSVTINASAPSSYSTLGSSVCTYKVYRSGNTVKVIINQATEPIKIVGDVAGTVNVTSGSNISNVSWSRENCSTTIATLSATFGSGFYPQFSYNSGNNIKISAAAGSGGIESISYNYTFSSNVLNITFTGLPTGYSSIPSIALTTHTLGSYNLTVNVSNASYSITYEGDVANVIIEPNTNYYITQAYTNSNTPEDIKYYAGVLTKTGNAHSIVYYANDETSMVIFTLRKLSGDLTLNIVTGNSKPILKVGGGATITGVALQTKLSGTSDTLACVGKATITGYTTTDGLDNVIVCATASAGFEFSHWEVDGNALDTTTYGISAYIPYEMLDGKILVAVFTENSAKTNTDTNTPDTGGFV